MAKRTRLLGPIGVRLALATVMVAIGAVGVLSLLTLLVARGDVSHLAQQEQDEAAAVTANVVTNAYRAAGSWGSAHLGPAASLAASSQAALSVLDASGRQVQLPPVPGASPPRVLEGPVRRYGVVVHREGVGTVIVHFYRNKLPTPEAHLRSALFHAVVAGAGLAVLLALAVALALSHWITGPVVALTQAVRSMGRGDRSARVGRPRGHGELAELAEAFDNMSDTIAHEEELRRAVVADVAHELRTPLAILQAVTESIVDGSREPSLEDVSSLHDEVLRLGLIVHDLETLASAEAAVLRMHIQACDLSEIAARTLEALRPSFHSAEVDLFVELAAVQALLDPDRAAQILGNLLTNALKFTQPQGSVKVTVTFDSDTAILEVSDTGTGIPSDELPHVFERFWRGRHAGRVAGSGIGLAVVSTLVKAQGATVDVVSKPAGGTRFRVRFPRAHTSKGAVAGATSQLSPSIEVSPVH